MNRDIFYKNLRMENKLLFFYSIIITTALFCISYLYMSKSNELTVNSQNYKDSISKITADRDFYKENGLMLAESLSGMIDVCTELDIDRDYLIACNEEKTIELEEFYEREELYDKYEYAIIWNNERTDLDYDQLRYLEDIVQDSSIPEPDLVLAFIMTESHADHMAINSSSNARGYGKFLNSTAKSLWEKQLGNDPDDWEPELAFDPYLNIQLMVEYIDYLYRRRGSVRGIIDGYTGGASDGYIACIDAYLRRAGSSLEELERKY